MPGDDVSAIARIAASLEVISSELSKMRMLMEYDYACKMNMQRRYSNEFEGVMKNVIENARRQSNGEFPNS